MGIIRTRRSRATGGYLAGAALTVVALALAAFLFRLDISTQVVAAAGQQQAQAGGGSGSGSGSGGGGGGGGGGTQRSPPSVKPLSAVQHRTDLGPLLEREKLQTGAELGVQVGTLCALQAHGMHTTCTRESDAQACAMQASPSFLVPLPLQLGFFSESLLTNWPSCTRFYLVDLWGHQKNYEDIANVDQAEQVCTCCSSKCPAWQPTCYCAASAQVCSMPRLASGSMSAVTCAS